MENFCANKKHTLKVGERRGGRTATIKERKKTSTTTKSNSFNLLWSIEIIPLSCQCFLREDTHFLSLIFMTFL